MNCLATNSLDGVTSKRIILLDFDDVDFDEVLYWARRACFWFKLNGFLIMRSSVNSCHVIFDKFVDWATNVSVMNSIAIQFDNEDFRSYVRLQCRKGQSTLRVGTKGYGGIPFPYFSEGSQVEEIKDYLDTRALLLNINLELRNRLVHSYFHIIKWRDNYECGN
jgi:hypothetical protein